MGLDLRLAHPGGGLVNNKTNGASTRAYEQALEIIPVGPEEQIVAAVVAGPTTASAVVGRAAVAVAFVAQLC